MIIASKLLKDFIKNQNNIEQFSRDCGLTKPTIYKVIGGDSVSNETMSALMKATGLDMSKAFEVKQ
jgi:DNA-binding phage protein